MMKRNLMTRGTLTALAVLAALALMIAAAPQLRALAGVTNPEAPDASLRQTGYESLDSPVDLLASYYDAINQQEYRRAYGYWESPIQTYNDFVTGFADTLSVQLIVQPPTRIGGAAGSAYAEIPTVLVADHTDGTQHFYAGCFTTRRSNLQPPDIPEEDVWHIYSADVTEVATDSDVPALLADACETAQG